MVGAIESYLAETAAHEETTSNFFGLSLILIIAGVAILLVRRLRRVKTRRAGRSYL
jgi:flagellar biogenesis protein FliO